MADNRNRLNSPTVRYRSVRKSAVNQACLLLLMGISCSESKTAAHKTASSHSGPSFKDYLELRFPTIVDSPLLKSNMTDMTNEGIDSLLRVLWIRDQKIRDSLVTTRRAATISSQDMVELGARMKEIDAVNFILLSRIFEKVGWPSNKVFSDSAVNAAYYITLHNTDSDLSHLSTILKNAFAHEQIDIVHYAVLADRILMRNGLSQKYATHCWQDRDGSISYMSLDDSVPVAHNRELIGLHDLDQNSCEMMFY